MIVLITTRGNGYTLKSMVDGTFGFPLPKFRPTHYERLFGAWSVPRATYIFGDLERLAPWELRLASELYRTMTEAGLTCLNDPARVQGRAELLTALWKKGLNPFGVWRADTEPRPERFPVFIRSENDHAKADATLHHDQEALDAALKALRDRGMPLRGLLVVEQASEPYADGLWAKWGTWRIGDQIICDHIAVDDTWLVKVGDHAKVSEEIARDEHDAVTTNRFAGEIAGAFNVSGIEFGRADHGRFGGRTIVYEINTNPYIGPFVADRNPLRHETQKHARGAIAAALQAIDTAPGGRIRLPATASRRPLRWWRPGFVTPRRP